MMMISMRLCKRTAMSYAGKGKAVRGEVPKQIYEDTLQSKVPPAPYAWMKAQLSPPPPTNQKLITTWRRILNHVAEHVTLRRPMRFRLALNRMDKELDTPSAPWEWKDIFAFVRPDQRFKYIGQTVMNHYVSLMLAIADGNQKAVKDLVIEDLSADILKEMSYRQDPFMPHSQFRYEYKGQEFKICMVWFRFTDAEKINPHVQENYKMANMIVRVKCLERARVMNGRDLVAGNLELSPSDVYLWFYGVVDQERKEIKWKIQHMHRIA
ncbi:hypothetical protein MP228_008525 [Amoeboaphelidium protococcarum]|nr:hypothetical protein MP228_008525 [Amoeboaphelidium protococcarum]